MPIRIVPIATNRGLSSLLLGVLALIAGCSLLAPSVAPAAHRRALTAGEGESPSVPRGVCSIALTAPSAQVPAGEPLALSGSLSCGNREEASEQAVSLYCRVLGIPGFTLCASATSAPDGSFEIRTLEALKSNELLYASAVGARSPRILVKPTSLVTISGPPSGAQLLIPGHTAAATALATNTITFTGTVTPAAPGTRVVLQRERDGSTGQWRRIALGEVGPEGAYSISHTFLLPGNATVRVVARGHGSLVSASEALTYVISRHQRSVTAGH
jgi:hypothetical protein